MAENFRNMSMEQVLHIMSDQHDLMKTYLKLINGTYKNMGDAIRHFEDRFTEFETRYNDILYEMISEDYDEYGPEEECFVYYILNEERDKVKIGISNDPISRAKAIQTASGEEIELLHTIKFDSRQTALDVEKFLHNRFNHWRKRPSKVSRSSEWFNAKIIQELQDDYWDEESLVKAVIADRKYTRKQLEKINFLI